MHKYFEKKPPKIKQKTGEDSDEEEGDDASLDEFADKMIEDKMNELNKGAGMNMDSEDDEISYSDAASGEEGEAEDDDMEDDGGDGFFGGQDDLDEVQLEDSDEGEELEGEIDDYGDEEALEEKQFKKASQPRAAESDSDEDIYGDEDDSEDDGEALPVDEDIHDNKSKSQKAREVRKANKA